MERHPEQVGRGGRHRSSEFVLREALELVQDSLVEPVEMTDQVGLQVQCRHPASVVGRGRRATRPRLARNPTGSYDGPARVQRVIMPSRVESSTVTVTEPAGASDGASVNGIHCVGGLPIGVARPALVSTGRSATAGPERRRAISFPSPPPAVAVKGVRQPLRTRSRFAPATPRPSSHELATTRGGRRRFSERITRSRCRSAVAWAIARLR